MLILLVQVVMAQGATIAPDGPTGTAAGRLFYERDRFFRLDSVQRVSSARTGLPELLCR